MTNLALDAFTNLFRVVSKVNEEAVERAPVDFELLGFPAIGPLPTPLERGR